MGGVDQDGESVIIVYLEADMLLTKRRFETWQEVQAFYPSYKANLGPFDADIAIDFLDFEYPDFVKETGQPWSGVVEQLITSDLEEIYLSKNGEWSIAC